MERSTRRTRRLVGGAATVVVLAATLVAPMARAAASVELELGASSVQDFDTLATSGTANPWTDDITLPGWFATATTYRASAGTDTTGGMYSFGSGTDRALGGLRSTTVGDLHVGLRLRNDTAFTVTSLAVSYVGEQWRDSGNLAAQRLAFAYLTDGDWTDVPALEFVSPTVTGAASPLDGNAAANRAALAATLGVALAPGDEIELRWTDVNDAGTDHGLAIDDVSVGVASVLDVTPPALSLPASVEAPAVSSAGTPVTFSASAVDDLDGPVPVTCEPTSGSAFPPGTTIVTCGAQDAAGNVALGTFPVTVRYTFDGYFAPIDNPGAGPTPVTNVVRAGAAVPVKFSLGGDMGLGVIERITRDQVPCGSLSSVDGIEETATAGTSGLSYDEETGVYTYVWKTEKAWSGSPSRCRVLDLVLADDTHRLAYFAFTR